MSSTRTSRRSLATVSVLAAGLIGGATLGSTVFANAAEGTPTPSASATAQDQAPPAVDESKSQRSDEQLLTGADADKARAAALAKYPGATIQRVETDSEGVYEAHVVTADGQRLVVQLDESFAVTGTQSGPGGGRGGAPSGTTPPEQTPAG